jgi:hypothetical protein
MHGANMKIEKKKKNNTWKAVAMANQNDMVT